MTHATRYLKKCFHQTIFEIKAARWQIGLMGVFQLFIVALLMLRNRGLFLYVLVPILFASVFFNINQKTRGDILLASLPISRAQMVIQKYILIILIMAMSVVFGLIIRFGMGFFPHYLASYKVMFSWKFFLFFAYPVLIIFSLTLPVYFKFGLFKGFYWFFGFGILFLIVNELIHREQLLISFLKLFSKIISRWGFTGLTLILGGITLGLYVISLSLSIFLYRRRDL